MVDLSDAAYTTILESLLNLLEDLALPYNGVSTHPTHVLQSELYIVALLADCCSFNWASASNSSDRATIGGRPLPKPIGEALVNRLFDALKQLLEPIPDSYVLPAEALLERISDRNIVVPRPDHASHQQKDVHPLAQLDSVVGCLTELDIHIKTVVEYASAASWPSSFTYVRSVVYSIRTSSFADASSELSSSLAAERPVLVVMRLLSFLWVDGVKLGQLIQELCSSYLHFRKSCQNTVAVVLPVLIMRWIDRCPDQFIRLHLLLKRLDGGADTLFDMTQTTVDSGKKRVTLYPLQMSLLLLLPDVFQVASNMKEVKSNSVAKKVSFLEALRKALRNGNERAGHCLVALLRAARHFDTENDSALVSYAMDVQDEVRDAIFGPTSLASPATDFSQNTITGACVSLANLNLNGNIATLIGACIAPSAPDSFKIAVVQTCTYFALENQPERCTGLLDRAISFIQAQFTVCATSSTLWVGTLLIAISRNIVALLLPLPRTASKSARRRLYAPSLDFWMLTQNP